MTEPAFDIAAAPLKAKLSAADAHPRSTEAGMRSVHSRVERTSSELQGDGIRAGLFLQDIGRMPSCT
jgi:hypothetical protein